VNILVGKTWHKFLILDIQKLKFFVRLIKSEKRIWFVFVLFDKKDGIH